MKLLRYGAVFLVLSASPCIAASDLQRNVPDATLIKAVSDFPDPVRKALSDCSFMNGDGPYSSDDGFMIRRNEREVYFVTCSLSATQVFQAVVSYDGKKAYRNRFHGIGTDNKIETNLFDMVANSSWNSEANELVARSSGGCAGNIGSYHRYGYQDHAFVLLEAATSTSDDCGDPRWRMVYGPDKGKAFDPFADEDKQQAQSTPADSTYASNGVFGNWTAECRPDGSCMLYNSGAGEPSIRISKPNGAILPSEIAIDVPSRRGKGGGITARLDGKEFREVFDPYPGVKAERVSDRLVVVTITNTGVISKFMEALERGETLEIYAVGEPPQSIRLYGSADGVKALYGGQSAATQSDDDSEPDIAHTQPVKAKPTNAAGALAVADLSAEIDRLKAEWSAAEKLKADVEGDLEMPTNAEASDAIWRLNAPLRFIGDCGDDGKPTCEQAEEYERLGTRAIVEKCGPAGVAHGGMPMPPGALACTGAVWLGPKQQEPFGKILYFYQAAGKWNIIY